MISHFFIFCAKCYFSRRNSISWPKNWRLSQDPQHGTIFFDDPSPNGALDHIVDPSSSVVDHVEHNRHFSVTKYGIEYDFFHTVEVSRPKLCGLDTREDDRCDVARAVLFGNSTSVGQICSIAEAVMIDPNNMPGSCCLDNVLTLENFGERVS